MSKVAGVTVRKLGILVGAAALAATFTLTTGCSYSGDRHVYESTSWYPQTLTLMDTRTGESIWSVDVPVGKQLIVGFRKGAGPNAAKPDVMYWSLTDAGRRSSNQRSQMAVPGPDARVLVPTKRPTPETPDTTMPGPAEARDVDEFQ